MTQQPDAVQTASSLTKQFGVHITAKVSEQNDGLHVKIWPAELHANEGFDIDATIGWRSVRAQLNVGNFAARLVADLGHADQESRDCAVILADLLRNAGGQILLAVNGSALDPFSHESWPYDWRTVGLSVERTPLAIDHDDEKSIRESVTTWAGGLLGMVIALLPAEEIIETSTAEAEGLWEGALKRVTVNRYERSRVNRAICIAVHGCTCAACGFDFRYHYGDLGDGFIHVHHVTPVSELGDGYRVDPRRDLVPVCANCHAMLHRRNPPLTVKELSELFTSQARNRAGPLSE